MHNHLSLKYNIFIIIVIVALFPILILSIVTTNISTTTLTAQEVSSKINILREISDSIYSSLEDRLIVAIGFMLDEDVQLLLTGDNSRSNSQLVKLGFEVEKMLQDYRNVLGTYSISLYSKEGDVYTNDMSKSLKLTEYTSTEWFRQAEKHNDNSFWGDPMKQNEVWFIPYVRVIQEIDTGRIIGYFIAQFKETYFYSLYENFSDPVISEFGIINSRNIIFSHSDKEVLSQPIAKLYDDQKPPVSVNRYSGFQYSKKNDTKYLNIYLDDPKTGWRYVNSVLYQEITKGSVYIQRITLILSVLLLLLCLILALILSDKIISPLKTLIERIERAKKGDWSIGSDPIRFSGEIGLLEMRFNETLKELKESVDNLVLSQRQKRRAELNALEMQINPHFLYNTMSSIIWLSDKHDNDAVITVAEALSTLFRVSISRGKEIITVREELLHVTSYVDILKVRYEDEFDFHLKVDPQVYDLHVIKLLLQPLIENAIYHGIKKNPEVFGVLYLEALINKGDLVFHVKDNGGQLDPIRVSELNSALETSDYTNAGIGIGIQNVQERVRLAYGKQYGIRFSRIGVQTCVTLTVPCQFREDEKMQDE